MKGNRLERSMLRIAHVTIETTGAMSISSGSLVHGEDAPLLLDPWGLPFVPGTSLAGVFRSVLSDVWDANLAAALFGEGPTSETDGWSSSVEVSHGYPNDSEGRVFKGLWGQSADLIENDPLLELLASLSTLGAIKRQRVRINERGVSDAEGHGLFDRSVVPKGVRFTFELAFWSRPDDAEAQAGWEELLATLGQPSFRLGGATRAGLGGIKVIQIRQGCWDMAIQPMDSTVHAAIHSFASEEHLQPTQMQESAKPKAGITHELQLTAEDFWRVGNASVPLDSIGDPDHADADLSPYRELWVDWKDGQATVENKAVLVPGSSIKGALRHRTLFHLNRLEKRFLKPCMPGDGEAEKPSIDHLVPEAINILFGSIKEGDGGKRGLVIVEDVLLPVEELQQAQTITHNSIDRFTGGVRKGFLFSEQMLWKTKLTLRITVLMQPASAETQSLKPTVLQAFESALEDLKSGQLSIGAADARGHGRFRMEPAQHLAGEGA